MAPFRVLFICMGNICRSPAADIVFHKVVADAGCDGDIEIDSAGTIGYHAGSPPDHRMAATLVARGYRIHGKARRVTAADLDRFDLVLAMDRERTRTPAFGIRREPPQDPPLHRVLHRP